MSAYIAIRYTAKGPVFATVSTIGEAHAYVGKWIDKRTLRLGEAVAIIRADTDQVLYFRYLSRVNVFLRAVYQTWLQCKQVVTNHSVATKPV